MALADLRHEAGPRARALTLDWRGDWNEDTQKGRNAACPLCGVFEVSVTPRAGKVLLICNACGAGKRGDDSLVLSAKLAGIECGAVTKNLRHRLWPATAQALDRMRPAEKRVLKFVAAQTSTGDWLEVSQREIAAACKTSKRDPIPLLKRFQARGLLRVRSNNYACKRLTQIAFLVDPADLCRRLENGVTPSENGVTMEHDEKMVSPPSQNGVTMEHPLVRIRGVLARNSCLATSEAEA
jgi:hypothetical protein